MEINFELKRKISSINKIIYTIDFNFVGNIKKNVKIFDLFDFDLFFFCLKYELIKIRFILIIFCYNFCEIYLYTDDACIKFKYIYYYFQYNDIYHYFQRI